MPRHAGIEEIGVQIEEPYSILPLEQLCDTLERNVWELHAMHAAGGSSRSSASQPYLTAGQVVRAVRRRRRPEPERQGSEGWRHAR